jgi:dTDP-4-dehydrorhamnose 3,5-epimerase
MGKLSLSTTPIEGLMVVETDAHIDTRGSFRRFFCNEELAPVLGTRTVCQINQSQTRQAGAVRGMHFQFPPYSEMKLVRCLRGRVLDVAVDLRSESKTFLQCFSIELTSENAKMIVIPERFAHGFQTLEDDCELLYLHTQIYHPGSEGGLRFDDPRLAIDWPLAVRDLSERDQHHPWIDNDYRGLN